MHYLDEFQSIVRSKHSLSEYSRQRLIHLILIDSACIVIDLYEDKHESHVGRLMIWLALMASHYETPLSDFLLNPKFATGGRIGKQTIGRIAIQINLTSEFGVLTDEEIFIMIRQFLYVIPYAIKPTGLDDIIRNTKSNI